MCMDGTNLPDDKSQPVGYAVLSWQSFFAEGGLVDASL